MFQRLKGAFDSIAEEQARPRSTQPSTNTSPFPTRRPNPRLDSPARQARQRKSTGNGELIPSLDGQDPDPTTFEADTLIVEAESTIVNETNLEETQPYAASDGKPGSQNGTTETIPEASSSADAMNTSAGEAKLDVAEMEVKVRRLNKLESKYQELLKAYRKAHARNSAIEPFEAKLREMTPLTSIADPSAFAEYLGQVSRKGDLVMDEFKRLSTEKDTLSKNLEDAERRCKEAHEQLKTSAAFDMTQQRTSDEPSGSGNLNRLSDADMFSVNEELPRMQQELEERSSRIEGLENQVEWFKQEHSILAGSKTRMQGELETSHEELTSVKTSAASEASMKTQLLEDKENEIKTLAVKVESLNDELKKKHGQIQHLQAEIAEKAEHHDKAKDSENDNVAADGNEDPSAKAQSSKKKKNRKKKRKQTKSGETEQAEDDTAQETPAELSAAPHLDDEKDRRIKRLCEKIDEQDGLAEEVDHLRDDLVNIGQELVTAKDAMKSLQEERTALLHKISNLEDDLEKSRSIAVEISEQSVLSADDRAAFQSRVEDLKRQLEENSSTAHAAAVSSDEIQQKLRSDFATLKARSDTVQQDLSAAQQLATSRYKEIAGMRESLQKLQPELVTLRTQIAEVTASREAVLSKNTELIAEQSAEQNAKARLDQLRQEMSSKETEVSMVREKLQKETASRVNMEENVKKYQRDLQRARNERIDAVTEMDNLTRRLEQAAQELESMQGKVRNLEQEMGQSTQETERLRDEISLKTAQHASAESLMSSVRDQASEMAAQMKEARARCESLEDELSDMHRLMSERGRESETMRRLVADVEGRSEGKVRELKEILDVAVHERDRAEEEARNIGRRRTRELDDVRKKMRNVQTQLDLTREEHLDAERLHVEIQAQQQEDIRRLERSVKELTELRSGMTELREALDLREKQAQQFEGERRALQVSLEEARSRLEQWQKSTKALNDDLNSLRAKQSRAKEPSVHSSRSSVESMRTGRVISPGLGGRETPSSVSLNTIATGTSSGIDYVHLKNVLLKFMEQRDKSYQMQLIPLLSMLLHFDRKDEQQWTNLINSR